MNFVCFFLMKIGIVQVPKLLEQQIQILLKKYPKANLKDATARIHQSLMSTGSEQLKIKAIQRAKEANQPRPLTMPHTLQYNDYEAAAYTGLRLPVHYGPLYNLYHQISLVYPDFKPKSLMDFGCGPGTAIWAAKQFWDINQVSAIDINEHMLAIVESWAQIHNSELHIPELELSRYQRIQKEFESKDQFDLVVSSYTLTDLPNDTNRTFTVESLWKQTRDILVLVDRGTPVGSEAILKARQRILDFSASRDIPVHVVAPVF